MEKTPWLIANRKIKVAVVGCGRIAQNHFEAIKQHSDHLLLIAVCDIDEVALEKASQAQGVKGYNNLAALLQAEPVDLVILCTPSGLHPQQTIMVARAGRHVLTEKPMATQWEDGLAMLKACDDAQVRLFVVMQNRRNATLQLLKNAIEQGRFGKIYLVTVNVFWTRPQAYYDQAAWRGTRLLDGGAFMNQASHYIDLLTWLLGPVASVQAMMGRLALDIEMEDTGVMTVRWCSGALGTVNVTMLTYPKNYEGSITILGEKGTVQIGGLAVNQIQQWEFSEVRPEDAVIHAANYETTSVYGFGHPLYYENVIKSLHGLEEPQTDGREGLKSLELLIAAYRSAQDGQPIHLPLSLEP